MFLCVFFWKSDKAAMLKKWFDKFLEIPLGYQIFHPVARNYVAFKPFNMSL